MNREDNINNIKSKKQHIFRDLHKSECIKNSLIDVDEKLTNINYSIKCIGEQIKKPSTREQKANFLTLLDELEEKLNVQSGNLAELSKLNQKSVDLKSEGV